MSQFYVSMTMNEWINAVYRQVSNFSAILKREQVKFWWDDEYVCILLDQHTYSWIFIVRAQWNNNPPAVMSLHSDTLSWFLSNQFSSFSVMQRALQRSSKYKFYQGSISQKVVSLRLIVSVIVSVISKLRVLNVRRNGQIFQWICIKFWEKRSKLSSKAGL